MSILTPFFKLIKPAKTDGLKVSDFNANMDTIDTEMHKPPLTVNEIEPDPVSRNIPLREVPLAGNLSSDIAQVVDGEFVERTSGGDASISSGYASLLTVKGNMVKTGYIPETLNMVVSPVNPDNPAAISASIDRDTFVAYVTSSATIELTYSGSWSEDPSTYGITVNGTPANGDEITVTYVKENRGTLTAATPTSYNSTGWNLFDNTAGYAKVVYYSSEYGYRIGGAYSLITFALSLSGERQTIVVTGGYFTIPANGYVFVTGGDASTYIYPTWSDWVDSYQGSFETYSVDTISLSEAMLNFPNGLLAVGNIRDEININTKRAINRIQRLAYTEENLANIIASGVAYDTDTNYIYAELQAPVTTAIEIEGDYTVSDHGIEFFTGTNVPAVTETLYGENLKDKLRTDVVTISPQTLTDPQKTQVRENIGAADAGDVAEMGAVLCGFIDPTRIIKTFTNTEDWIATENCWVLVQGVGDNGTGSVQINIDEVYFWTSTAYGGSWRNSCLIPIKKGQLVGYKRTGSATGDAKVFAMLH